MLSFNGDFLHSFMKTVDLMWKYYVISVLVWFRGFLWQFYVFLNELLGFTRKWNSDAVCFLLWEVYVQQLKKLYLFIYCHWQPWYFNSGQVRVCNAKAADHYNWGWHSNVFIGTMQPLFWQDKKQKLHVIKMSMLLSSQILS